MRGLANIDNIGEGLMAVSQNERLEAVLSKLESIENELRQTKRIIQYYRLHDKGITDCTVEPSPATDDREGLYPGQIDWQDTERPSALKAEAKQIAEEEIGTCAT